MINQLLERWKKWYGLTDEQTRSLANDKRIIDHANYIEPLLRESLKKRVEYIEQMPEPKSVDYADMTFIDLINKTEVKK